MTSFGPTWQKLCDAVQRDKIEAMRLIFYLQTNDSMSHWVKKVGRTILPVPPSSYAHGPIISSICKNVIVSYLIFDMRVLSVCKNLYEHESFWIAVSPYNYCIIYMNITSWNVICLATYYKLKCNIFSYILQVEICS